MSDPIFANDHLSSEVPSRNTSNTASHPAGAETVPLPKLCLMVSMLNTATASPSDCHMLSASPAWTVSACPLVHSSSTETSYIRMPSDSACEDANSAAEPIPAVSLTMNVNGLSP